MSSTNTRRRNKVRPDTTKLIDRPPCIVIPSLEMILGLNEARLVQQLFYWMQGGWQEERLGKLERRTFYGRHYVKVPPGYFEDPFNGAIGSWSKSTRDRTASSARSAGVLRTADFGGEYNTNWYCVYDDHIAFLGRIYDQFYKQVVHEYKLASSETSNNKRLKPARVNAIWKNCKRHLDAGKKQCFEMMQAEIKAQKGRENEAQELPFDPELTDEEIEANLWELLQNDATGEAYPEQEELGEAEVDAKRDTNPVNLQQPQMQNEEDIAAERVTSSIKMTQLSPYIVEQQQRIEEEQQQEQAHATEIFSEAQVSVVVVDSSKLGTASPHSIPIPTPEALLEGLLKAGLDEDFARDAMAGAVSKYPKATFEVCVVQLEFWPHQGKDNPGFLRRAIENDWPAPVAFKRHVKALESARSASERASATEETQRLQNAQKQAENERARERLDYCETIWASLASVERDLVVQKALKMADDQGREFVRDRYQRTSQENAKSGKNDGKGEIPLEWRNRAIEELLDDGEIEAPTVEAEPPQSQRAPVAAPPASDEDIEADAVFEALNQTGQRLILGKIEQTLGDLPDTPKARETFLTMRRALIREMFSQAQAESVEVELGEQTSEGEERKTA